MSTVPRYLFIPPYVEEKIPVYPLSKPDWEKEIVDATEILKTHLATTQLFINEIFSVNLDVPCSIVPNESNACWDGKRLSIGIVGLRGGSEHPLRLSDYMEVIARQIAHVFLDTINVHLPYYGPSGAILVSSADIFATMAKAWSANKQNLRISYGSLWTIGTDIAHKLPPRVGIPQEGFPRFFFSDPPLYRKYPYESDKGKIHTNATILDHIFFQMCTEAGLPIIKAGTIWFRALQEIRRQQKSYTFINLSCMVIELIKNEGNTQLTNKVQSIWNTVIHQTFGTKEPQKAPYSQSHRSQPHEPDKRPGAGLQIDLSLTVTGNL